MPAPCANDVMQVARKNRRAWLGPDPARAQAVPDAVGYDDRWRIFINVARTELRDSAGLGHREISAEGQLGMLTRPQVQRYAAESGLRDIMIAEKEVVLTFLLQLLSERGILARLAFKGGTCLRKMFVGDAGPVFNRSRFHGH